MGKLKLHNTLGNKVEEFIPIDKNNIRIYACGPTVYNYAHIGNARMAVVNDLLVQFLRTIYPKVTYVSNITDIDDKTIRRSIEEKMSLEDFTDKYTSSFFEDIEALQIIKAQHYPRATEFIPQMIETIQELEKKGFINKTIK